MHLVRRHFFLRKQVGREHREERNCANYHFHSCWSTQGPLLIKLKEIKFNCNQLPQAPQKCTHGREGTVGRKSVASLLSVPCDSWVTGSAGKATSLRHTLVPFTQDHPPGSIHGRLLPIQASVYIHGHVLCAVAEKCHWACRCPQQGACSQGTSDPVAEKRATWEPGKNF